MSKISFEYEGTEYTLEYTKRTIKAMEAEGFVPGDIDSKPMTMLPLLFAGAFKAHHRFVRQEVIDDIYDSLPDKEGLVGALAEMYNEQLTCLMKEPEPGKNVSWTVIK